ncbi:YitT family protein [Floccifex sp.]|uniref:YitT family protein n=1 Tax=Floccifex sp. TaxID=2815810 RepID=UPI003F02380E
MKKIKDFIVITIGISITAVAVYFFLIPSHAAISSISGFAIVLSNFIPLAVSDITMILNVALLVLGFILIGNEFGGKTIYASILLPALLKVFEILFPDFQSITNDPILDAAAYVFVVSIGQCILFNMNASSGGLDIVAKILNKYLRLDLGKAMTYSGMLIALSSCLAYDGKTVVLSILGTYLNGIILDQFIFEQDLKRRICIVSNKIDDIRNFILNDLKSGATIYEAYGAYKMEKRQEIIVIVNKAEYQKLMKFIEQFDPEAFITVYKVNEISYKPKKI